MLLYKCVKALLYLLICFTGVLFVAGRKKPRCMAAALMMIPMCMLLYWIQKMLWQRANQKKPVVCVEATLVNHRQEFNGSRMQTYQKSFLTFEVGSGEQIEFEVSREEFERIQLGAKGMLQYRGNLYVSFRKPSS